MKRYQIIAPIGSGGTVTVYRALDRLTGHPVALKRVERIHGVTLSDATEAAVLQSLTHEFSVLASMRHPNIITVLDYGFEQHDRPYFIMELLENARTIVDAAHNAPLQVQLSLLLQLLQALAYLHRRGVLHRDLKPSNVLVVDGNVRVLDFGLASLGHSNNEFAGTAAYMAPEMLWEKRYVPASDLYAVGVLAVEIFTGHLPFKVGDVLAILNQAPDLGCIEQNVVRDCLEKLLAKDPVSRFADIDAVIASFAEISGISVIEQPPIRESYLQAAPFIGREAELTWLTDALTALLDGQGHAVLIGGESGVGKSRLINELRIRALTAGALVWGGQALQEGGLPFYLWHQILANLIINSDAEQISELEAGVLKEVVPDTERLLGRKVMEIPVLDRDAGAQRLAFTVVSILQRLKQPVVLLMEDLQWAGESLQVLEVIARSTSRFPLLIIGTYRSDEAPLLPQRFPLMTAIQLQRFQRDEIEALCRAMVGKTAESAELVKNLERESEGNVFFLIEILRVLAEHAGMLKQIGQSEFPDVLFPQGISHIMQRRLAFVPEWAQPLLKLAALIGRQIDMSLLS